MCRGFLLVCFEGGGDAKDPQRRGWAGVRVGSPGMAVVFFVMPSLFLETSTELLKTRTPLLCSREGV